MNKYTCFKINMKFQNKPTSAKHGRDMMRRCDVTNMYTSGGPTFTLDLFIIFVSWILSLQFGI